jgi:hypothetical protein
VEIGEGKVSLVLLVVGDADFRWLAHVNAVLAEDILHYAVLFSEIAYFEREMYAEAKPIYELLGADPVVCDSQYVFFLNGTHPN